MPIIYRFIFFPPAWKVGAFQEALTAHRQCWQRHFSWGGHPALPATRRCPQSQIPPRTGGDWWTTSWWCWCSTSCPWASSVLGAKKASGILGGIRESIGSKEDDPSAQHGWGLRSSSTWSAALSSRLLRTQQTSIGAGPAEGYGDAEATGTSDLWEKAKGAGPI